MISNSTSFNRPLSKKKKLVISLFETVKPRSHSAGMAPVHPGGGQPVYRHEPGHFS